MVIRGILTLVFSLSVLLLCEGDAQAIRCGGRLASAGDSSLEVRHICGEPHQVVRTTDRQMARVSYGSSGQAVMVEVQVEIWTYNFGPHRFMRELRFENGVLVRERSLGYGH